MGRPRQDGASVVAIYCQCCGNKTAVPIFAKSSVFCSKECIRKGAPVPIVKPVFLGLKR